MIGRIAVMALALTGWMPARIEAQKLHEAVVSQDELASKIGASILARGGNAVDAAVATAFALAVTHPGAGNVGGGGFMVVQPAAGEATCFDFRETAPHAIAADVFLDAEGRYDPKLHHDSHLSVGVPGTVAGLWLAHRRLGRLPWRDLVAPAVALARDGFVVTEALARSLEAHADRLRPHAASRRQFFKPDGSSYRVGDLLRQPDLAGTLERILRRGADGFYRGETADAIVAEMRRGGGLIDHEDLASYRARERAPIRGTYRGHDIISMPPPSSGGITLVLMLNMLETFPVTRDPVDRLHLLCEIMRRAYAERARRLGDPDFNDDAAMRSITKKKFARKLAAKIDLGHATPSRITDVIPQTAAEGDHTTHLSVFDRDGAAVSLTYTLEYQYGSGITVPGAGFLLNNEMGDFNPKAGLTTRTGLIGTPPNLVAPGKRMLSSMTPTIVGDDGRPRLIVGTPGGRTIINTVFQIISDVIDLDMDIRRAVALGRIHHQWFPDRLLIEDSLLTDDVRRGLTELGHELRPVKAIGAAQCILVPRWRPRPWVIPAPDPRALGSGWGGR